MNSPTVSVPKIDSVTHGSIHGADVRPEGGR
jgi:hypothetical protein